MNTDGSGQANVSNNAVNDTTPSWSTTGKIAFASDRDQPGYPSIYWMNSNGTNQTRLTFSGAGLRDEQPVWAPNGSKIAFTSTRNSTTDIWTETDDYEIPEDDGQTFPKSRLNINKEVYLMNPDGSGQTRLTNDLSNDDSPTWSPDSAKIVFRSERERDLFDATPQLWTMNADGSGQTNLSNSGDSDFSPSWTSGSANQPPVAVPGGPYSGVVNQNASFSGNGSYDPDGSIVTYAWTFGDGGTGSGVAPYHAYATTGTFTVTLTVTDNLGAQAIGSTTINISASSSDQYATSFLQWALGRPPNAEETTYWTDIFRAAYPKGLSSMKLATRELGMTVFESAEYAARNRNDHWYVYDLYKTFLMREPDVDGWAYWEAAIPIYGRDQIRRGFDESTEFANIVATLTASGSPSSNVSSLATALADPFNQTGNQLQARDAEWSANLLSLPGRAGLDLGLSVSYSSLVFTRSGPYRYFDADNGSPSPGFHIGFPTIQDRYFDAQVGANVYLLKTAAGRRIELRQAGTSNIYESADSSYLQLTAGGSLELRTTDGTTLNFGWTSINEYRCTWIRDRNGNYILINYDWRGDLQNVTDTLGRVITFNYDANANLNSITQIWNGQAHMWASFGWENVTMSPTVTGVVGTYSGETIPGLKMVAFHDGTYTKFLYNGNGQVRQITQYASDSNPTTDNHPRNYTAFDYDSSSSDCPRLISTRTWAEYWTGVNGVPTEVTTNFGVEGDTRVLTAPDGTVYKETYAGNADAAWMRGLVKSSEVRSGGVQQKLSTVAWTQDNPNVVYKTNPRVIETNVYDSVGNRRRTTIDYSVAAYAQYGLPYFVREYATDATTPLRTKYSDYNLAPEYLERRIIGLVDTVHVFDHVTGAYVSKVHLSYDWDNQSNTYLIDQGAATQHDNVNYGAAFRAGRGNICAVRRWNVNAINDWNQGQWVSFMGYNTNGSVIFTADALGHETRFSYADSFSDGNNSRNTFGYPTTVTDADGFSSTVQYNFDFGAKTRLEGPPPQNQPNGIIQTFAYDSAARLQRTTTANTGAYTHNVYGSNYVQSYSSVNTVAQNYLNSDLYNVQVFDGAGRVFNAASYHPGSVGGYRAGNTIYDRMGRAVQQSNPTEITGNWLPAGDDAYNAQTGEGGWRYTQQSYNWQGRPLRTTHPDGYYKEASYSGCGCAGGEVVTLQGEEVPINGEWKRRTQKIYSDVLGRQWKSEILNWNGTVYSASVSVFNARDQVKIGNQYAGSAPAEASSTNENVSCPDGTCQKTALAYDGFGRLLTKHVPEQNAGTATVYTYNSDDTVQSVTDARGASATYIYNNGRHLVNEIHYSAPGGITPTSSVTLGYDAAGNRTSMNDGMGSASYSHNQLSQVTSEMRTFTGLGSFTLSYDYNQAGQLKRVTDHTNSTINYGFDSSGRLNGITGSDNLFSGVSDYSSGFVYRAWGGLKQVAIGGTHTSSVSYNSRLQATNFNISGGAANQNYEYSNDGRLSFAHNTPDNRFDRSFSFDHAGRLLLAATGGAARNDTGPVPAYQTFAYNAWDDTISRDTTTWTHDYSDWGSYTNHRRADWGYDADGRVITIDTRAYTYDAAGNTRLLTGEKWMPGDHYIPTSTASDFDGDGQKIREVNNGSNPTYYLRSSVLKGAIIEELDSSGQKQLGYVYTPAGSLIARQMSFTNAVALKQVSPNGATQYEFLKGEGVAPSIVRRELDPMGADIKLNPWPVRPNGGPGNIPSAGGSADGRFGAIENPAAGCMQLLDGSPTPCDWINRMAGSGALQLQVGNSRYDIQMFGDSHMWVDAWEEYFTPGRGYNGRDANGREEYDAGTTGIRSVGYFVTIPGGTPMASTVQLRETLHSRREITSGEVVSLRQQLQNLIKGRCKEFLESTMSQVPDGVYSGNLMNLFNWMADHGTLMRDDFLRGSKGQPILGHGGGNAVDGKPFKAGVTLNFTFGRSVVFTLIHELVHANGRAGSQSISHATMATVALATLSSEDLKEYQSRLPTLALEVWRRGEENADTHNSQVFQNILEFKCDPIYAHRPR